MNKLTAVCLKVSLLRFPWRPGLQKRPLRVTPPKCAILSDLSSACAAITVAEFNILFLPLTCPATQAPISEIRRASVSRAAPQSIASAASSEPLRKLSATPAATSPAAPSPPPPPRSAPAPPPQTRPVHPALYSP